MSIVTLSQVQTTVECFIVGHTQIYFKISVHATYKRQEHVYVYD